MIKKFNYKKSTVKYCKRLKQLQTIISRITNINHSILIQCYSTRSGKLSWSASMCAK